MLRTTIILAASAMLASSAEAADSACKGLDFAKCAEAKATCYWMPAIEVGTPKASKPDETYKVTRKAHCRARPGSKPATDKPEVTG